LTPVVETNHSVVAGRKRQSLRRPWPWR